MNYQIKMSSRNETLDSLKVEADVVPVMMNAFCIFLTFKYTFKVSKYICNQIKRGNQKIDAHGLKIQGRVYFKFLPKSLGGWVKAFRKNCPILGFIAFLLTSVLKFAGGGGEVLYLPYHFPLTALWPCVHL
jgi:hypothetical protein